MNPRDAGATLLTGSLALRLGMVKSDDLSRAFQLWSDDDASSIEQILAKEFGLSSDDIHSLSIARQAWLETHQSNWREDFALLPVPDELRAMALELSGGLDGQTKFDPKGVSTPEEADPNATQVLHETVLADSRLPPSGSTEVCDATSAFDVSGGSGASAREQGSDDDRTMQARASSDETIAQSQNSQSRPGVEGEATVDVQNPFPSDMDVTQPQESGRAAGRKPDPRSGGGGEANQTAPDSRFQRIRAHAKGGLGEVFLAFDLELRREVALKEIQDRFADNYESRSRFITEAEVTGGLEHPGIVPVYGFGRYRDGRPFYAMRFIQGQSLKEAVEAFHNPKKKLLIAQKDLEFRQLLGRFIDVCNAIGFAHSRGVLHRDIKPANVMLGDFGETLVVDWGLAKALDHQESLSGDPAQFLKPRLTDSGTETMIGSTVGTPSYMCPERAAGRHDLVGVESDVYSLGAMLYTILTGVQPFVERNIALLLMKVQRWDFPTPRKVNKKVPAALEAVCLKAMAKSPADRYHTARALAQDVEHWLADEPVSVYREPLTIRLGRWAKRHRTLVATSAAVFVLGSFALGVGTVLIKREQARTEQTFQLAKAAVDRMLTELAEVELAEVPQMEPVRKRMLAEALAFYRKFLEDRGQDFALKQESARANLRLGEILDMLGESAAGEKNDREAVVILEKLSKTTDVERDLGDAHHKLGVLLKSLNRFAEGETELNAAIAIRKRLAAAKDASEDDFQDEKATVYQLGALLARMPGKLVDAQGLYQEAIDAERKLVEQARARADDKRKLARYLNNWGILLKKTDVAAAEAVFRDALGIEDKLETDLKSLAGYQWERARCRSNLGATLDTLKRHEESVELLARAAEDFRSLSASFPSVPDYAAELAATSSNLAMAQRHLNKTAEAQANLEKAVSALEGLVDRFPQRPNYRYLLGGTLSNLGVFLAELGRKSEAAAAFERGAKVLEPLLEQNPGVAEYQLAVGMVHERTALLALEENKLDQARTYLERAIAHYRRSLAASKRYLVVKKALASDLAFLAKVLLTQGEHTAASRIIDDLAETAADDFDGLRRAARFSASLAELAAKDPKLGESERRAQFESNASRAIKLLKASINKGLADPSELTSPSYDAIRNLPEFEAVRKTLESKAKIRIG